MVQKKYKKTNKKKKYNKKTKVLRGGTCPPKCGGPSPSAPKVKTQAPAAPVAPSERRLTKAAQKEERTKASLKSALNKQRTYTQLVASGTPLRPSVSSLMITAHQTNVESKRKAFTKAEEQHKNLKDKIMAAAQYKQNIQDLQNASAIKLRNTILANKERIQMQQEREDATKQLTKANGTLPTRWKVTQYLAKRNVVSNNAEKTRLYSAIMKKPYLSNINKDSGYIEVNE